LNGRDLPPRIGNEVTLLVAGGIIDSDTASAISSRDPFEPDNRNSRARAMIAVPGTLVLGADATAFIACNMSAIARLQEPAVIRRALLSIFAVCSACRCEDSGTCVPKNGNGEYRQAYMTSVVPSVLCTRPTTRLIIWAPVYNRDMLCSSKFPSKGICYQLAP
jgi:hypothetical protein